MKKQLFKIFKSLLIEVLLVESLKIKNENTRASVRRFLIEVRDGTFTDKTSI